MRLCVRFVSNFLVRKTVDFCAIFHQPIGNCLYCKANLACHMAKSLERIAIFKVMSFICPLLLRKKKLGKNYDFSIEIYSRIPPIRIHWMNTLSFHMNPSLQIWDFIGFIANKFSTVIHAKTHVETIECQFSKQRHSPRNIFDKIYYSDTSWFILLHDTISKTNKKWASQEHRQMFHTAIDSSSYCRTAWMVNNKYKMKNFTLTKRKSNHIKLHDGTRWSEQFPSWVNIQSDVFIFVAFHFYWFNDGFSITLLYISSWVFDSIFYPFPQKTFWTLHMIT